MTNSDTFVQRSARAAESIIADEVKDAMWADFGKMVEKNIHSPEFVAVLNRAGLKSKTTAEFVGYIRAFLLTGAKP